MTKDDIVIAREFRKARNNLVIGFAYSIDDLINVDKLSDKIVFAVIAKLDNHPLIHIDNNLPKRWSLR